MSKNYQHITAEIAKGKKLLAVLIDPDKFSDLSELDVTLNNISVAKVDIIFIGGSLLTKDNFDACLSYIKSKIDIPVIIFPGGNNQVSAKADAILFLSLISGRNPEYLIGKQVATAPIIKQIGLEAISTGYILVDCGNETAVSYISNTKAIPYEKHNIARATAMAGEMLGMKMIYCDGGSGAAKPISVKTISKVKSSISVPLIIGGGIKTKEAAQKAWNAGADIIVIGTAIEENPELVLEWR